MNQQVLTYLPVISPVATLVVVMLGVLLNNRHVDTRISGVIRHMDARFNDMRDIIRSEGGRLEATLRLELKTEISSLRQDILKVDQRVERLETQRLVR
jgi:hypothetical protein